jgi:hypothetical protein
MSVLLKYQIQYAFLSTVNYTESSSYRHKLKEKKTLQDLKISLITGPPSNTESPVVSPNPVTDVKFLGFNFSPLRSPKGNKNSPNGKSQISFEKSPKRSRSLIRRSSNKFKQQIQNVQNPDDCVVS